jgi:hypothetical protein
MNAWQEQDGTIKAQMNASEWQLCTMLAIMNDLKSVVHVYTNEWIIISATYFSNLNEGITAIRVNYVHIIWCVYMIAVNQYKGIARKDGTW